MAHDNESYSPPARLEPIIRAAPKLRQVYWCNFGRDRIAPEIWKIRPAIILSYKNTLYGICMVIPVTTRPPSDMTWSVKLTTKLDADDSWAICNHPVTVSTARFTFIRGAIPMITTGEADQIIEKLRNWIPRPFGADS